MGSWGLELKTWSFSIQDSIFSTRAMQNGDDSQIVTKQVEHEDKSDVLMVPIDWWAGMTDTEKGWFSTKYHQKRNILSVTVGVNPIIYMNQL